MTSQGRGYEVVGNPATRRDGAMRKIRGYAIGVVVGALLMLGGQAVADIPDNGGTKLYFCVYQEATAGGQKAWQVLDKDKGSCNFGWTEHAITVVPDP